jgi:hypothetical protein
MTFSIRPPIKCTTQDYARRAVLKLRALCCALAARGMRHDQIAAEIGAHPRTLSSWKAGTTVPHWAIEALESVVEMKAARKVGT